MSSDPFVLEMDTVVSASKLLGHALDDRRRIREQQDERVLDAIQAASALPLTNAQQQHLFAVAPIDVLVSQVEGAKRFHIIELNGTGIGGLTNMTSRAVDAILASLSEMTAVTQEPNALILLAISGKESDDAPRLNRQIHEKLLFAEALKRGFESQGRAASITTMSEVNAQPAILQNEGPLVVLGYIKEFLDALRLEANGRLSLAGRLVTGAVNDRFCMNLLTKFGNQIDLDQLATMNRCFLACADKGVVYDLLNDFLEERPYAGFPSKVRYEHAGSRSSLIAVVMDWVRRGRQVVIKPHGTGIGHGIEFFLSRDESKEEILRKINRSIQETEEYYCLPGGAFPYTVCEFIDACTIDRPGHPMFGHKYELRVAVYRDGLSLQAFPSIAKISSRRYDPDNPDRLSLINNVTASTQENNSSGSQHVLPLSNRETWDLLGLTFDDMQQLCGAATAFVRFVLDQAQETPYRLGLRSNGNSQHVGMPQLPEEAPTIRW